MRSWARAFLRRSRRDMFATMRVDVAREHGGRLDGAIQKLLSAEPYLAYANFPPIARREGALLALHVRHWLAAADLAGVLVAATSTISRSPCSVSNTGISSRSTSAA